MFRSILYIELWMFTRKHFFKHSVQKGYYHDCYKNYTFQLTPEVLDGALLLPSSLHESCIMTARKSKIILHIVTVCVHIWLCYYCQYQIVIIIISSITYILVSIKALYSYDCVLSILQCKCHIFLLPLVSHHTLSTLLACIL